ncbi:MAG: GNAT family N-acetyltransferase [Spirochaetaceae bacterium]|nr:GNAT family N-acetyltransferase [Spirochaetaceae bacterium]
MEFELSPEVFDQVIFAMEDQGSNAYIHRRDGTLVPQPPDDPSEFVPLPAWKPVDGFYLMERFVASVSNPHVRRQLRSALSTGRGVFRSFKNVLKQSRDLERRWYRFKEKEMRRVVLDWYNQEREAAGLERLGPEPEETDDLTVSDFVVVPAQATHLDGAHLVDVEALMELRQVPARDLGSHLEQRRCELAAPASHLVVACAPQDEVVGMAWARACSADQWDLVQLAVMPYYRGLGLAARLLQALADRAEEQGVTTLHAQLGAAALGVSGLFEKVGFSVDSLHLKLPLAGGARVQRVAAHGGTAVRS